MGKVNKKVTEGGGQIMSNWGSRIEWKVGELSRRRGEKQKALVCVLGLH